MSECIRNLIYGNPTWLALYQDPANDAALITLLNDDSEQQVNQSTYEDRGGQLRAGHQNNRSMNHDFRIVYADDPAGAEVKAAEMTGEFNRVVDSFIRANEESADPALAREAANLRSYKGQFDSNDGLDFADSQVQNMLIQLFGLADSLPYRNLGFYAISPAQKSCQVDATQNDIDACRRIDGRINVDNRNAAADEAARQAELAGKSYQEIVDDAGVAWDNYAGGP